jgi:hypothetical protein
MILLGFESNILLYLWLNFYSIRTVPAFSVTGFKTSGSTPACSPPSTLSSAAFNTAIRVLFYELRTHFKYGEGGRIFLPPLTTPVARKSKRFSLCWKNNFCFSLISIEKMIFPCCTSWGNLYLTETYKQNENAICAIRETNYFCLSLEAHLRGLS